jgi:hypothetical protein
MDQRYVLSENGKLLCAYTQNDEGYCVCFHCKKYIVLRKQRCRESIAQCDVYPFVYRMSSLKGTVVGM